MLAWQPLASISNVSSVPIVGSKLRTRQRTSHEAKQEEKQTMQIYYDYRHGSRRPWPARAYGRCLRRVDVGVE